MSRSGTSRSVWWLSPVAVTLVVAFISIIPAAFIGDERFRVLWNTPKVLTTETCALFLAGAMTIALGALVVIALMPGRDGAVRWPNLEPTDIALLRKASIVLFALTLVGYLAFAFVILKAGISWDDVTGTAEVNGEIPLKKRASTIAGLTTLTQVGIASTIVSSLLLCYKRTAGEVAKLSILFILSILRAFIWSERLAFLELVVPVIVIYVSHRASVTKSRRGLISVAPVVALPALFSIFGFFEYFRSWAYYRTISNENFATFVGERLAAYYVTGLNNGQIEMNQLATPGRWPFATIEALWTAPGLSSVGMYEKLSAGSPSLDGRGTPDPLALLEKFGSIEFNNPSGYGEVFLDYGRFGAFAYFLLVGILAGVLYCRMRQSRATGLLFYPLIYVGLLEFPRYIHWAQGRTTPALVSLLVVAILLHRSRLSASRLSATRRRVRLASPAAV
jgi:oligosaccharide repeat unit polymerase